jgi:hypothetical protein
VNAGSSVEDSRVELKSEWPKPEQAARQIAAHANAARGAPILWLIGVDEKKGTIGVKHDELANWFPSVVSFFEGITPEFLDVNIIDTDLTITALLFYTERAPFLVKNPSFGIKSGGPVELEVPWREGRRTRTARRADLIRLLEPLIRMPKIELLGSKVVVNERRNKEGEVFYDWYVYMDFYFIPSHGIPTVIPFHKCKLTLSINEFKYCGTWKRFSIKPPTYMLLPGAGRTGLHTKVDSLTIAATDAELIAEGPGRAHLSAEAVFYPDSEFVQQVVSLNVQLLPVGGNVPIIISDELPPVSMKEKENHFAKWSTKEL